MTTAKVLRTGLLGAALFAGSGAWAADTNSQTFITNAIQGNLAEISVGQLAQQKGSSDAVKRFGETLVADHTKANQQAMTVAKELGVTPPTQPNAEQQSMHDKLAGESGGAFDKDFASGMVQDHQKDIAEYQQASSANDAAGQYAKMTLPTLQQHLATAQNLAGQSGSMTDNAGGAPLQSGANSFTEGEAKARIERSGYTGVSDLKKDDQGIWRGTATKNGQSVSVGLDYKGNIASK